VVDAQAAGSKNAIGALARTAVPMAAVILLIGGMIAVAPRPAAAKPEFAAKTGFPCGQCHVSQTGGGTLKAYGQAFKANGFEVPKKK
jgi:hypothetical protein